MRAVEIVELRDGSKQRLLDRAIQKAIGENRHNDIDLIEGKYAYIPWKDMAKIQLQKGIDLRLE